jgi:hypothetical protein
LKNQTDNKESPMTISIHFVFSEKKSEC